MEFAGNNVKVLVDAFGRMMVMNDGGNISGVAWNDEGITDDFDNMGSMSTQFNAIRNEWGEHDCITEDTGTTVTFTTDDEPVLLTFDTQTNNFVPVVGELANRQETMWLRTIPVNDIATTVVVNDNGEPVVLFDRNGYTKFLKATYDGGDLVISETNDSATLTALETYAGGLAEITVEDSSDGDFHKYIDSDNDGYFFITNQDAYITMGTLNVFTETQAIAVDGAVQVFADEGCTKYASANQQTIYVRLNRAFNYGGNKNWGSPGDEASYLAIVTPNSEDPDYKYSINAYVEFGSQDYDDPFVAGQIVPCTASSYLLNNKKVIFRDE